MPKRSKVSIIGAGHVGGATAHWLAAKDIADIVLLDIPQSGDMPRGKALDLMQSGPIEGFSTRVNGTNDYADTAGSDIVVITAGIPRKPGMSRDDLLTTNAMIVEQVSKSVVEYSPDTFLIVVSNPLDAMVYAAWKASGLPTHKVMGQAGVLDTARFRTFISMELGVSMQDISTVLLGGHGDAMIPLPRYTTVGGIPVTQLIEPTRLEEIVQRARDGGAEIVKLLQSGSAFEAPASATVQMVEAILLDKKRLLPCAVYCDKEYDVGGYFVGVPAVLGADGVEKIVEVDLTPDEREAFAASVTGVKELVDLISAPATAVV
ncbi:MAG: malate dehydrogenase [bacterium]|nr:malate dehydrogenase [bacterium]